jgi:DNA-binding XRE family transcriptional regulator
MSILMLGLVTSGFDSLAAGEAQIKKQASQSRGDIGGFVLDGADLVQLLNLGLESKMTFGGRVGEVRSFASTLSARLPRVEVKTPTPVAVAKPTPVKAAAPVKTLKEARKEAGISQEVLGSWLDVSRKVIGKWENEGTTDANLAKAFKMIKQLSK